MAVDKLVDSSQLDADLTSVANAIRTKGGTSASLAFPADFVSAIQAIPSGGGGNETGSFIGSGSTNATISVSSTHSHIHIWLEDVRSDDTVSSTDFQKYEIIEYYADNSTGFYSITAVDNQQTAFDGRTGGIGRWGNNTGWNNRVEFTDSTIKIISANYAGSGAKFNGNKTYSWEAW